MPNNKEKLEFHGGLKVGDEAVASITEAIEDAVTEMLTDAKRIANASGSRRIGPGHVRSAYENKYGDDDAYIADASYHSPSFNETEEERMQSLRKLQED